MGAAERNTAEPKPDGAFAAPPERRGLASGLRRALPWAVAAAILWYLFRRIPVADAWRAAEQARLGIFVPCAMVAVSFWFLLESGAFAYMFSRFNATLSWAEARSLRGLTYLVTPINWNLGTATIILHLRRSKGIGAIESTSSLLFYVTIDAIVLGSLALVGISLLPMSPVIEQIGPILLGFVAFEIALLAFFMAPAPDWRWLLRIRSLRLFRTHGIATWRDVALLSLIRAAYFGGFVLLFWIGTRAFNVELPLGAAMASTPVILAAGGIPITPAGLGTQQAAMLYFFSSYGSEAAILAFGLTFPVALTLARMPLGLLYIRDLAALRSSASS
jgi:uncharacterized membrane protein YbhN (UPF0104 family)